MSRGYGWRPPPAREGVCAAGARGSCASLPACWCTGAAPCSSAERRQPGAGGLSGRAWCACRTSNPLALAAAPHRPAGPRRGTARRCRRAPTISRAARPAAGRLPGARRPAPRAALLTARLAPRRSALCHAVNKVGSARVRASGSRMEGPVRTAPAERSGPFPREAPRRRPEDLSVRAEMVIVGVSLTCRRGWSPPPCWPGPGDADRCAGACEGGVGESAP